MPLFLELHLSNECKLAVWQVTESAGELMNLLPEFVEEDGLRKPIPNELLYRQRLASRILLSRMLQSDSIRLGRAGVKRTILIQPQAELSISHAGRFAAVMVSKQKRCGVDIEEIHPRIARIAPRFMNEQEWNYLRHPEDFQMLMLLWSVKETVFKYGQDEDVEFKTDIICAPFTIADEGKVTVKFSSQGISEELTVDYTLFENYILTRVMG
ncbi:MAG: 4'-phosphopantetheinyl transferase superfamily protein [Bacteroidia bacterium]|nr:4'-phosphopantetheinyl transferase superfamily protein [Bacteroidia bacterium]